MRYTLLALGAMNLRCATIPDHPSTKVHKLLDHCVSSASVESESDAINRTVGSPYLMRPGGDLHGTRGYPASVSRLEQ